MKNPDFSSREGDSQQPSSFERSHISPLVGIAIGLVDEDLVPYLETHFPEGVSQITSSEDVSPALAKALHFFNALITHLPHVDPPSLEITEEQLIGGLQLHYADGPVSRLLQNWVFLNEQGVLNFDVDNVFHEEPDEEYALAKR